VVGRIKHLENDESRSAQQEGTPPYDFSRMSLELGILEEQLNCSQIQMFFVGLYINVADVIDLAKNRFPNASAAAGLCHHA
jgi:hypothetical protein